MNTEHNRSKKRSRAQFEADHNMSSSLQAEIEQRTHAKRVKLNDHATGNLSRRVKDLTIEEDKTPERSQFELTKKFSNQNPLTNLNVPPTSEQQ